VTADAAGGSVAVFESDPVRPVIFSAARAAEPLTFTCLPPRNGRRAALNLS
jgi:hypothetical protein